MKVLLVKPISNSYIITPPVGLGYIATALRKAGHGVQILDCNKEKLSFQDFERFVIQEEPDAIGFQVFSCDVDSVKRSLEIVKRINPSIITMIGGAHPSGAPQEAMDYLRHAEFGFKGEGEVGVPLLIDYMDKRREADLDTIPGLIRRLKKGIIVNKQVFIEDLDSFGLPAWDLMPPNDYC